MLNYRRNGRRRFGRSLKRLLDEAESGPSKPNSLQMIMKIFNVNFSKNKKKTKKYLNTVNSLIRNIIHSSALLYSKGKAVPLQAWSGPEGSRKLTFPDYVTTAQDGGKVVSLTHRPPLPPGNVPVTHFC